MNITVTNGTAQQRDWVREALTHCSFPLAAFPVSVAVTFGDPPANADSRHPYMVTVPLSTTEYEITIQPWADDPGNPNNKGLPNPQGDIKDFFMESVIHEIGHVLVESTFDSLDAGTDPRVARCCSAFWEPQLDSGSGRRYGSQADWKATGKDWPAMIKEAVAEVFKCAFYTGRHVFMNRTRWRLDEADWSFFLSLLSTPPGGIQPITFDDRFLADDLASSYELRAEYNNFAATTGGGSFTATHGVATVYSKQMPLFWAPADPGFAWYSIIKIESLAVRDLGGGNSVVLPPQVGFGDLAGELGGMSSGLTGDQFPYWLRWWEDPSIHVVHIEGWNTDPDLGGAPVASSHFANIDNPAQPVPIMQVYAEGGVGDELDTVIEPVTGVFQISEWRVHTYRDVPAEAPGGSYPFGDPNGVLLPGPAAQGNLVIGAAR